ncbi:MAG: hypothetical protein M3280_02185 [Actinomycetota bacterium]|nr:hypothetical protein [Actinomycetota bacterium]
MTTKRRFRKRVDERAKEILNAREEAGKVAEGDEEKAHKAAETMLEESEERTFDPATADPDKDTVIRRSSDETTTKT